MVPEGWKNKLIKEVTTWNSGGTPSMRKKSYWNGDIPWISASTMQCHVFETSTKFITKEGLKSGSKLAAKNSLLLLVRGSMLWNKIPVGIAKRDLAFNQDVKSVTANSLLLPLFLLYWFLANENKLLHMVTGTGIGAGKLDTNELLSLRIALPPLPEQKKIAKILSTWDQAIEVTEKLIANSQQQKKSLMQQLLTGKKRLPGFSGEWEEVELGNLVKYSKGFTYKSSDYSDSSSKYGFFTLKSIEKGGGFNKNGLKYLTREVDKKFEVKPGDIIFAITDITRNAEVVGAPVLVPNLNLRFSAISMDMIRLDIIADVSKEYLFYALKLRDSRCFMRARASGSTVLHLDVKGSKKLKLKIPDTLEEQQKIASVLSAADKEIETLQQKLKCLKLEKKALMQQLLTGKRRVKIDEEAI